VAIPFILSSAACSSGPNPSGFPSGSSSEGKIVLPKATSGSALVELPDSRLPVHMNLAPNAHLPSEPPNGKTYHWIDPLFGDELALVLFEAFEGQKPTAETGPGLIVINRDPSNATLTYFSLHGECEIVIDRSDASYLRGTFRCSALSEVDGSTTFTGSGSFSAVA
jgi:hypothetical protein